MSKTRQAIRTSIALVLTTVLVALPVTAHTQQSAREVNASIEAATGWPIHLYGQESVDHARCSYLALGDASQGHTGYMVKLHPEEGDGRHQFTASLPADTPGNTLHPSWTYGVVTFYRELGSCPTGEQEVTGVFRIHTSDSPYDTGPWRSPRIIPAGSQYALIVPFHYVWVGLQPNYCLFPWCFLSWVIYSTGYPGRHVVQLRIDQVQ
jgi:hypothetical protein